MAQKGGKRPGAGRPARKGGTVRVTYSLPAGTAQMVEEMAARQGLTKSEVANSLMVWGRGINEWHNKNH